MVNNNDPFRTKSKKEIEQELVEAKRIADKIADTVKKAQTCLASTDFTKYRDSAQGAIDGLLNLMLMNQDMEPLRFAFFAKACLAKIDVFKQMMEMPEKDAKRGNV